MCGKVISVHSLWQTQILICVRIKDKANLSTFNFSFSRNIMFYCPGSLFGYCPIVRINFCVIHIISYHIFAIYVGGASLGLPTACRLIAVRRARFPWANGLVVRCIKMRHHVKSAITICLQFISNMFTIYKCITIKYGINYLSIAKPQRLHRWSLV